MRVYTSSVEIGCTLFLFQVQCAQLLILHMKMEQIGHHMRKGAGMVGDLDKTHFTV